MESFSKDIHTILRELNQSEQEADELISVVKKIESFSLFEQISNLNKM